MEKATMKDYYWEKLQSDPQYKKYTPTNFAAFLLEVRDFVMEMPEMMQDDSEMDALLKEGLEDVYSGRKLEGAKKVRKAAEGRSPLALWLLGLHLTANVKSKKDVHLGIGCLYTVERMFRGVKRVFSAACYFLGCCYAFRSTQGLYLYGDGEKRYAPCFVSREDECGVRRYKQVLYWGMIRNQGYLMIGSMRINIGWYKKPIEVIVTDGKVDVYVAPYMGVEDVWEKVGKKVGILRMNELAGVRLRESEGLPPNFLRVLDVNGQQGHDFANYFFPGTYMELATGLLVFRTQPTKDLSYELCEEEEDAAPMWIVNIPEDWDIKTVSVQNDIARYINNILFPIAQETLPAFFDDLKEEYNWKEESCKVIEGDEPIAMENNAPKGLDFIIPSYVIKYPFKFLEEYFLSHLDDGKKENMTMAHCYDQLNDPNTTTMNDRYLESWGQLRREAYPFLFTE